ncbi:MAG: hypothetical protein DRI57_13620 [Deltaproteobacteria bacterium]|nr:MAG: hypothetical protein DRI57_13620 [Deltaproteobacteria bacterium]
MPETAEKFLFSEKAYPVPIFPENCYVRNVCGLPNIEAVICKNVSGFRHISTILNKRDVETSERIYEIEMKVSELYPDEQFYFTVDWIHEDDDLSLIIRDNEVLFRKGPIYAEQRKISGNH